MSLTLSPAQHLSVCVLPSDVCSVLSALTSLVLLLQPGGAGRASLPAELCSGSQSTSGPVALCHLLELNSEQLLGEGFGGAFTSVMDPIADTPPTF